MDIRTFVIPSGSPFTAKRKPVTDSCRWMRLTSCQRAIPPCAFTANSRSSFMEISWWVVMGVKSSAVQEHSGMRQETIGVLELRSMTGIRVDNELGVRDRLRHVIRVDRRDHDVVVAVDDEGGL